MKSAKGPIKRSPYIVALSRDHHHALLLGWKIRKGLSGKVDPVRIAALATDFNEKHLKNHFRQEEDLLFRHLPDADPLREKGYRDHEQLQQLFDQIRTAPGSDTLEKLTRDLDEHIRFEERMLFPHLEDLLPEPVLQDAAARLEAEHQPVPDDWEDRFW
ncbi:MAG TPA: hemerythrin domain-containing protein [Chitinophagaceae bacterium]|nr:hemerythrin domain-containing protein [Chitinophagaceae bacterium]